MPLLKVTYGLLMIGMILSGLAGAAQYLDGTLPLMIVAAVGFGLAAVAARVADHIVGLLTDIRSAVSDGNHSRR
ncbi:hypothetical protein ACEYYA_02390 [Paracoccus sp. p3-h83]